MSEMKFTSGQDKGWWVKIWLNQICIATMQGVCQDEAIAIAKELVRRWDAFEKDGLVDELLATCKKLIENEPYGITPYFDEALRKIEAAIARARP